MPQKLGQHFLKNKEICGKIANALHLAPNETVIEIGGGHGELTGFIVKKLENLKNTKLIVIEKDPNLAHKLKNDFNQEHGTVIEGDARTILPQITKSLPSSSYVVVGNIPYYLTGYLLRIISELPHKPSRTILTIQKEVAERIVATPPHMNIVATITQTWARPKILFTIPKKEFAPPPKVDSAVILLQALEEKNEKKFFKFVRTLFKQPRKTINNNLNKVIAREKINDYLKELKIPKDARPQNLTLQQIKEIYEFIRRNS